MAGEQQYVLVNVTTAWVCQGCGVLVIDKALHDYLHEKTRSVV